MSEVEVTAAVSVEAMIHVALKAVFETALAEHGLRVNDVRVNWLSVATLEQPSRAVIDSMRVETQS